MKNVHYHKEKLVIHYVKILILNYLIIKKDKFVSKKVDYNNLLLNKIIHVHKHKEMNKLVLIKEKLKKLYYN